MRSLTRKKKRHLTPDAARAANNQSDLPAELSFRGHALQLGLFERPILDSECFRARQRHIIVEVRKLLRLLCAARLWQGVQKLSPSSRAVGACHHVNRVDEKLRRDPCFLLILTKAKQSKSRNDNHRWIRITQLRRIARRPILIIFVVRRAILRPPAFVCSPSMLPRPVLPDPNPRKAGIPLCVRNDPGNLCQAHSAHATTWSPQR